MMQLSLFDQPVEVTEKDKFLAYLDTQGTLEEMSLDQLRDIANAYDTHPDSYAQEWMWWEASGGIDKAAHLDVFERLAGYLESEVGLNWCAELRKHGNVTVSSLDVFYEHGDALIYWGAWRQLGGRYLHDWPTELEQLRKKAAHISEDVIISNVNFDGVEIVCDYNNKHMLDLYGNQPFPEEIISYYGPEDLVEDGLFIDITDEATPEEMEQGKSLCGDLGIVDQVIISRAMNDLLDNIPEGSGQDRIGRLWDLLNFVRNILKKNDEVFGALLPAKSYFYCDHIKDGHRYRRVDFRVNRQPSRMGINYTLVTLEDDPGNSD